MSDQSRPGGRAPSHALPPPTPPKPRKRWRYSPDDFQDGRDYVAWPTSWSGMTRHPRADRSNRIAPWGIDHETGLVIAPFGISPVSGCPRLIPATIGSLRNQHPPKRGRSDSISAYSSAIAKALGDNLERRLVALLGCDPLAPMVAIINDPEASRVERIMAWRAVMPYVLPRKKSIDITSKKEVTTKYVIEVPALPDAPAQPILEMKPDE